LLILSDPMNPPLGKLIIITAPSGAGKTTLVRHLLSKYDYLEFSTSATTRERRPHEVEGKDYFFLTKEQFQKLIKEDAFAEWEEVYEGQFYGTLLSEIEERQISGKHIIFDIDVQGAIRLRSKYPRESLIIFINPLSMKVLEDRLRSRKTEPEEKIQARLAKASSELKLAYSFDKVLINDELEVALKEVDAIIENYIGKQH